MQSSDWNRLESLGHGAMFDRIAHRYDLLNRLMSFGIDASWRRALVRTVCAAWHGSEGDALDLATGTGDVAFALARALPNVSVLGLDASQEMLKHAQTKARRLSLTHRVQLVHGNAYELPFASERFAACTIAFGLRNLHERAAALRQVVRVLKPGGVFVCLELGEPRGGLISALARWHVHYLVPALGALLSKPHEYRYLQASIAAFPEPATVLREFGQAGLVEARCERLTFGTAHLFVGKKPLTN